MIKHCLTSEITLGFANNFTNLFCDLSRQILICRICQYVQHIYNTYTTPIPVYTLGWLQIKKIFFPHANVCRYFINRNLMLYVCVIETMAYSYFTIIIRFSILVFHIVVLLLERLHVPSISYIVELFKLGKIKPLKILLMLVFMK